MAPSDGPDDSLLVQTSTVERHSTATVRAVASVTGKPVTRLPPLYDVLDPGTLDSFLQSAEDDASVSFPYCGYRVIARGGSVSVYESSDAE